MKEEQTNTEGLPHKPLPRRYKRMRSLLTNSFEAVKVGGPATFVFLLLVGAAVMILLFASVHNQKPETVVAKTQPRYEQLIMFWHREGYFKYGGLWIRQGPGNFNAPKPGEQVRWAYRTASMGHLQVAHVLQRVHLLATGSYSKTLMSIHNQALIGIAAAMLGLLAMRLVLRLGAQGLHALLPAVAVQLVFQTFPPNLAYYWETSSSSMVSIFAIGFLLSSEMFLLNSPRFGTNLLRGCCVFGMVWCDAYIAIFFIGVYVLACAVWGYPVSERQSLATTILLPAALALGLFGAQILWVKLTIPGLEFLGHASREGVLFRTGLDGSSLLVKGHTELLRFNRFNSSLKWVSLFLAGVASLIVTLRLNHKLVELKYPTFILAVAAGLYIPFAFVFGQGVSIHPYFYDTYLVIPLTLSLFAVLPAALERLTGNRGVFSFVFSMSAVCYAMVSLRTYAMDYPV